MSSKKAIVYKVVLKTSARKELGKLPKQAYVLIQSALNSLSHNPRPKQSRKMVGSKNQWRLRVLTYRVIYTVMDSELIVEIIRVAHRREVYRK